MKIELVEVATQKPGSYWHLRLIGSNGRCMMHSENYFDRSTARRAANRLAKRFKLKVVSRWE